MFDTIHVVFAISSLVLGGRIFFAEKGRKKHRVFGCLYSLSMLLMNLSALSVYEDSEKMGPFHMLALVSLATLSAGIIPVFLRKPRDAWLNMHAYFMSWSYVGLVAAGVGQMATMLSSLPATIAVGLPSIVIIVGGGLLIHTRVPEAVEALTSRNIQPNKAL